MSELETPPVGEELHLPGETALPVVSAAAITLIVIGTTINWLFSLVGLVVFLITTWMWIRDNRRDMSELPDEHRHR